MCSALVDDSAQWARRSAFAQPDYRQIELTFCHRLLAAVSTGDGAAAEIAMKEYIEAVRERLVPELQED